MTNMRIAYVVNNVAFFISHRLPIASAIKNKGAEVALFTGMPGSNIMEDDTAQDILSDAKIFHRKAVFTSSGVNPFIEFFGLLQILWFVFRFKPDLMHCISPKGVLYGGIVARLCNINGVVFAISGMGYAYTDSGNNKFLRKLIRKIYDAIMNFVFNHNNLHIIVQNQDDYLWVLKKFPLNKEHVTLIPGSGVNLDLFKNCNAQKKESIVLLPARMLKDKGVVEFIEAVRLIKKKISPQWRFLLAGAADYDNPSAISSSELKKWQAEGVIEWIGYVKNMEYWFCKAAIVCLPSYREGLPKALIEGGVSACAIITSDAPGCREAIIPGETGELIPVRNSQALSDALLLLIRDEKKRILYGQAGQVRAMKMFSIQSVIDQNLDIYKRLIHHE